MAVSNHNTFCDMFSYQKMAVDGPNIRRDMSLVMRRREHESQRQQFCNAGLFVLARVQACEMSRVFARKLVSDESSSSSYLLWVWAATLLLPLLNDEENFDLIVVVVLLYHVRE